MAWPESTAYCEAVQNPRVTFGDAELQAGQLATNLLGLPLVHVGNFAAVFQMRRPAGPPDWALKCFTRQVHGLRRRYQAIHTHLDGRRLPFMVQFAYQADGILVRGERYPLLKMDWVEGLRLDEFLGDCLGKPGAKGVLRRLSQMWLKLSVMLREAAVGHGDLQHGNVMLVPVPGSDALALKLIDYDGMYVPELAGQAPGEIGHPAYQHPGRTSKTGYGPEVDRFSHLVIYTTLQALIAGGRDLWQQFYNGDRLLLGPNDFRDPKNSEAFRTLWQLDNPDVRALTGHLALAAAGSVENVPVLSQLATESGVLVLSAEQQVRAAEMLGSAGQVRQVAARTKQPLDALSEPLESGAVPELDLLSVIDEWDSADAFSPSPVSTAPKLLPPSRPRAAPPPEFDFADWLKDRASVLAAVASGLCTSLLLLVVWTVVFRGPSQTDERSLPTITNSIGMTLVEIPAGEFLMAAADSDREAQRDEKPQHRVRITRPFYLGVYPVAQSQWERVMGSTTSRFKGPDHPVENVSWNDCQDFIRRLNERPEEQGGVYRLPTESEWEYASRAGRPLALPTIKANPTLIVLPVTGGVRYAVRPSC